jgi:hypothetical protein
MQTINAYYLQLLHLGFIVLRQALDSKDWEWADHERQFLHNIPSLINETNTKRHECFWIHERDMYLEWVNRRGGEPQSRMLTYYEPTLREMEPAMLAFLGQPAIPTLPKWQSSDSPAPSPAG